MNNESFYQLLAAGWSLRCGRKAGQAVYYAHRRAWMRVADWERFIRACAVFAYSGVEWIDYLSFERRARLQGKNIRKLVWMGLVVIAPAGPEHRSGRPGRPPESVVYLSDLGRSCMEAYLGVLCGPPVDQVGDVLSKRKKDEIRRRAAKL